MLVNSGPILDGCLSTIGGIPDGDCGRATLVSRIGGYEISLGLLLLGHVAGILAVETWDYAYGALDGSTPSRLKWAPSFRGYQIDGRLGRQLCVAITS